MNDNCSLPFAPFIFQPIATKALKDCSSNSSQMIQSSLFHAWGCLPRKRLHAEHAGFSFWAAFGCGISRYSWLCLQLFRSCPSGLVHCGLSSHILSSSLEAKTMVPTKLVFSKTINGKCGVVVRGQNVASMRFQLAWFLQLRMVIFLGNWASDELPPMGGYQCWWWWATLYNYIVLTCPNHMVSIGIPLLIDSCVPSKQGLHIHGWKRDPWRTAEVIDFLKAFSALADGDSKDRAPWEPQIYMGTLRITLQLSFSKHTEVGFEYPNLRTYHNTPLYKLASPVIIGVMRWNHVVGVGIARSFDGLFMTFLFFLSSPDPKFVNSQN